VPRAPASHTAALVNTPPSCSPSPPACAMHTPPAPNSSARSVYSHTTPIIIICLRYRRYLNH